VSSGRTASGLSLPQAQDEYDPQTFQYLLDYLRDLEEASYLRNTHLEVWSPPGAGGRQPEFILRSPDGARWLIRVDNAGNLTTTDAGTLGASR
jgi:hypothetical protein